MNAQEARDRANKYNEWPVMEHIEAAAKNGQYNLIVGASIPYDEYEMLVELGFVVSSDAQQTIINWI